MQLFASIKAKMEGAPSPTPLSQADVEKLAAKLFVFGFDGNGTTPAEHARRMIAKGSRLGTLLDRVCVVRGSALEKDPYNLGATVGCFVF
jgi:hypothetical protein